MPHNPPNIYPCLRYQDAPAAISWLKNAIGAKRYCCYQFPHFNLGRVQLMKGQLQEAKRSFEQSLSYDPNYLPAHQGLVFIRSQGEDL